LRKNELLVETKGSKQWLGELFKRYKQEDTLFRESEEAFTILISPSPNNTILVARYCRPTGKGVVLDRRKEVRNE
jgi:hypothetical protein